MANALGSVSARPRNKQSVISAANMFTNAAITHAVVDKRLDQLRSVLLDIISVTLRSDGQEELFVDDQSRVKRTINSCLTQES